MNTKIYKRSSIKLILKKHKFTMSMNLGDKYKISDFTSPFLFVLAPKIVCINTCGLVKKLVDLSGGGGGGVKKEVKGNPCSFGIS